MKQRNPNDALFRLIKSMSQGEKRFFNMLCQRQASAKGKVYLKLFQQIDKLNENDEVYLKQQLNLTGIHFIAAKRYLFSLVQDAMVQYYKSHMESSLYGKLLEMEVLFEKRLYELYEIILFKVRKIAEDKNDFLVVLETFRAEKKLRTAQKKYPDIDQVKKLRARENYFTGLYKEVEDYRELQNEIHYYHTRYLKIDSKAYREIAARPLFKNITQPGSLMAKLLLHASRAAYYYRLGDYKTALAEHTVEVQLAESNAVFQKSNPGFTFTAYMNYILTCITLKEYDKALNAVAKYKKFISRYPEMMKQRMMELCIKELIIYKDTFRRKESTDLIKSTENKLESKEMITSDENKFLFYINASYAFLLFKENHLSLRKANKILNAPEAEKNYFLYYYNARILQLINLFELKDNDLLAYRVKAFRRLMLKRGPLTGIDEAIMNFFQELLKKNNNDGAALYTLLTRLKSTLEKMLKDPSENGILISYADLSNWLENAIARSGAKKIPAKK